MSELKFGWLENEAVPEVMQFLNDHWSAGHILSRDESLFKWQYAGPSQSGLAVLTVRDGETLGGMMGVIPVDFCLNGTRLKGGWLTMWRSVEGFGPAQLGLQILQKTISEFPVSGTMGGNANTIKILTALRFKVQHRLNRWVKPINVEALNSVVAALGDGYDNSQLAAWSQKELITDRAWTIAEWTVETAEQWDQLWTEEFAPQLVSVWRDRSYIQWRYADHPTFKYTVLVALDGAGDAAGILVYRLADIRDRSEKVARIVELLAVPGAGEALLGEMEKRTSKEGAAFADFYCTSKICSEMLENMNFYEEDVEGTPLPSLFQPLDVSRTALNFALKVPAEFKDALEGDNLYFTKSDCDQDRPN